MTTPQPGPSSDDHRDVVAVLVGGEARRLGGLWKPGLWWNGSSILQRRLGDLRATAAGTPPLAAEVLLAGSLPTSDDLAQQRCIARLLGDAALSRQAVADVGFTEQGRPAGPGGPVAALLDGLRGRADRLAVMAGDVCVPIRRELELLRATIDRDRGTRGAVILAPDGAPVWDRSLWKIADLAVAAGDWQAPPLWKVLGASDRLDRSGLATTVLATLANTSAESREVLPSDGRSENTVLGPGRSEDIDTPADLAAAIGKDTIRLGVVIVGDGDSAETLRSLQKVWAGHLVEVLEPEAVLECLDGSLPAAVDAIGLLVAK